MSEYKWEPTEKQHVSVLQRFAALTRALAADAEHDAYALAEIRRWRDVAGEAARLAQEGTDAT